MKNAPTFSAQNARLQSADGAVVLVNTDEISADTSVTTIKTWFDPAYWQQKNAVVGTSHGRNTVYFVMANARHWVLRHYYRGGLPGKLWKDQFLYLGEARSRSFAEFQLLQHMRGLGLPVPTPVAAHVQRSGLYYRADLLIERIVNSQDLFKALQHAELSDATWHRIGFTVAAFHRHHVFHSDLNCHNILLQTQNEREQVHLIDFDRCRIRQPGAWQQENLQRLQRSLIKERKTIQDEHGNAFYYHDSNWQMLLEGYREGMSVNEIAKTPTKTGYE
ncbi:MAG: 3-deoxy-D-manno-octulosonic acid kinase [Aliidiomarina sp.]|uniref:3-deoxy-D-manno-octulosonic acid kinase n=1 Tax=Aliidiomarina sp. TaxID=1872439 RepID=UPI0025B8EC83|nr:3-deoxy-D-manno-octulosonic acid kinase [Aliidiomarina sp.]MCH8501812.1 3-deoxy-D-manno-octulosonic acid kinase [Aliidiomarina sp.]